jgi:hypothetical protein
MDEGWDKIRFFIEMRVEKREKTRRREEAVCGKGRGAGGGEGRKKVYSHSGYFMYSISFDTG